MGKVNTAISFLTVRSPPTQNKLNYIPNITRQISKARTGFEFLIDGKALFSLFAQECPGQGTCLMRLLLACISNPHTLHSGNLDLGDLDKRV
jgi:hypothetical protein